MWAFVYIYMRKKLGENNLFTKDLSLTQTNHLIFTHGHLLLLVLLIDCGFCWIRFKYVDDTFTLSFWPTINNQYLIISIKFYE